MNKPKKASIMHLVITLLIIGVISFITGFFLLSEKKELEETWRRVKAKVTMSNYEDNKITEVEYYIMDEKYKVELDDYESRDYKGKELTLYVNINDHYDVKRTIGNEPGMQACFAIGTLLIVVSSAYIAYRSYKKLQRERLIKTGEHHKLSIKEVRFDYKTLIKKQHPEYALIEFKDEDQLLKYKSEKYFGLGEYIEKKEITKADVYINPMDNRKYAIVFGFEKK